MQLTKTHKIIISAAIIIVLFGLYVVFDSRSKGNLPATGNSALATTTNSASGATAKEIGNTGVNISGEGNFKVEQVGVVPEPIPNLGKPVVFGTDPSLVSSLTPEIKNQILQKISGLQTQLKKDPVDWTGWINLGRYQKMAGDYSATVESWQYASKLAPTDFISLGDLGNLYAYFLKDNAKAESYYKQAIANGPTQAYLYVQLAEVYRDIIKDPVKALATVNSGLTKIPSDPNLLQLKASLIK